MKALVEAVVESITDEIPAAGNWHIETHDRMWRNPKAGKVLNVYAEALQPDTPVWTGSTMDMIEITAEYGEPTRGQKKLTRDADADESANEVADSIRAWAAAHPEGLPPAWKLDYGGHFYTPRVRPEMFMRYVRCSLQFTVVTEFS